MKTFKLVSIKLFVVYIITAFISCKKDNGNGNVLVKVKCNTEKIAQAVVYVKYNASSNPHVPLNSYDRKITCDAIGEAYIDNLPPDNYYYFAKGYSGILHKYVSGEQVIKIIKRYRMNERALNINTN